MPTSCAAGSARQDDEVPGLVSRAPAAAAGLGAEEPRASFNGTVEEIDEGRSRVKVAVSIFGRTTSVKLEVGEVQKL